MNRRIILHVACSFLCVFTFMNRLTGATLYWDGADTSSAADGGSGLWSATSSVLNWSDAAINGNAAAWSSGDSAVFGGLAGIVTLGATHTAGSVRFNVDGYVLDTAGYDLTLSQLDGNGSFTKSGAGALTVTSRGSSYTGKITIDGGVLKLGDIEGVLGAYNTSVDKITVRPGGTFDVAGQYDGQYGATLAGTGSAGQGAMINSGADTGSGHIQTQNIALSDDATIGGSGNFYMIAPGFAPGFLYLNGHTLTKIGANTFGLGNTWVSKGTVRIEAGKISLLRAIGATNTTFWIANDANAALTLNSNSLILGAIAGGGAHGGNVLLGTATLDVGWLNTSTTYAGSISGTGALIKRGTGTLTLNGASTYSGPTPVYNGGLVLNGSLTSAITIGSDGWIQGVGSTTKTLSMNGGVLKVAGDDHTKPGLAADGIDFLKATQVDFVYGPTAGKTYEILRYGSSGVTGYTNLLVDYRGTLTNDAVNQVISFIASGDGHSTRTWNTLNGTWDLAVSDNWAEGDHLFYKGDHAVFGNISTDVVVTVSGTLYPASVTISADNNQYTFSGGTIAGYTDISKTGNGVCEIAMANRQKGTIRAKAGTIKVGHAEAFGAHFAGSPVDQVVVSAGATVDFNGVIDANYGYIIAGNGVGNVGALINSGSEISTAKKQCRRINLAADASIGGINNWALLNAGYQPTTLELNGHTLTKIGSNTISFVNTTISTGTVRIAAGALAQYNTGIVGGSQTMFELDNTPNATFALNNISTAIGGISGGGKISLGSGALTVGLLNTANTFHGAFLGSGKLIKAGTNVLVISGTSPLFTGNVMVNGGTLKLDQYNQQNILGATRADVNKIQVATGATLDIGGLDDTYYGVTIAGSGVDGKGALINSGAGTSLGRIQTPFLALAGDATIGGVGNFAMIAGNYYPNAITLNGFKLTKTGVNTFTVASTTIATGEVHIAQGVFAQHTTLAAGSTTVDASCARFTLADAAGVELRLNNKAFSAGSLEGGGVTGGLVSLGSAKLTLGNLATNALFSGTITGSGGIIKVGGGTQGFNGVYNYSGPTVVSNGTLVVNGTHQSGGSYTVVNNAVLAGSGSVSVATGSVTIEAGGAISPGAQAMAGGTLTVNTLTMATDAKLIIDNLEDSLIVTGNLWLDNARVLVSDTTQLDKARTYQLVTCNGNVTGAFNKKVDDSLWVVSRRGSTFALVYSSGAVMLIR